MSKDIYKSINKLQLNADLIRAGEPPRGPKSGDDTREHVR